MRIYKGAILFVDILGISALTKADMDTVTKDDFAAFGKTKKIILRNQVFCAVLLTKFRRNLRSGTSRKLRIAQLSDCAFIWSDDINQVVEFASALFWQNLRSGLLCRGGLTYGEIVEPEKIGRGIGDFVCGEAVTRSVELERVGKGSRIFIDREIGGKKFSNTPANAFEPVSSPIDFRTIDEYLWFALPPKEVVQLRTAAEHVMNIIDASLRLRFAPHFRWNTSSAEGRLHVGATIERMQMYALQFCKERQLPVPEFAFVSSDFFMEIKNLDGSAERDARTYASMKRLAADYRRRHFPKSLLGNRDLKEVLTQTTDPKAHGGGETQPDRPGRPRAPRRVL